MNKLVAEFWTVVGVTWCVGSIIMGLVGYYSFNDPFFQILVSMSSTTGALCGLERWRMREER